MNDLFHDEIPEEQAKADAGDMLKSLFMEYDRDENGMDWKEFKDMAVAPRDAFGGEEVMHDLEVI